VREREVYDRNTLESEGRPEEICSDRRLSSTDNRPEEELSISIPRTISSAKHDKRENLKKRELTHSANHLC